MSLKSDFLIRYIMASYITALLIDRGGIRKTEKGFSSRSTVTSLNFYSIPSTSIVIKI